jgi:hypothetical protein
MSFKRGLSERLRFRRGGDEGDLGSGFVGFGSADQDTDVADGRVAKRARLCIARPPTRLKPKGGCAPAWAVCREPRGLPARIDRGAAGVSVARLFRTRAFQVVGGEPSVVRPGVVVCRELSQPLAFRRQLTVASRTTHLITIAHRPLHPAGAMLQRNRAGVPVGLRRFRPQFKEIAGVEIRQHEAGAAGAEACRRIAPRTPKQSPRKQASGLPGISRCAGNGEHRPMLNRSRELTLGGAAPDPAGMGVVVIFDDPNLGMVEV